MPSKKSPTNQTTEDVLNYLLRLKIYAWRNNTQGTYDQKLGRYRPSGAKVGVSDILGILPHYIFPQRPPIGQLLAIEVKTGRDKLSPQQEGFLNTIKKQGGIALVIKTYEDFKEQFQAYELSHTRHNKTSNDASPAAASHTDSGAEGEGNGSAGGDY